MIAALCLAVLSALGSAGSGPGFDRRIADLGEIMALEPAEARNVALLVELAILHLRRADQREERQAEHERGAEAEAAEAARRAAYDDRAIAAAVLRRAVAVDERSDARYRALRILAALLEGFARTTESQTEADDHFRESIVWLDHIRDELPHDDPRAASASRRKGELLLHQIGHSEARCEHAEQLCTSTLAVDEDDVRGLRCLAHARTCRDELALAANAYGKMLRAAVAMESVSYTRDAATGLAASLVSLGLGFEAAKVAVHTRAGTDAGLVWLALAHEYAREKDNLDAPAACAWAAEHAATSVSRQRAIWTGVGVASRRGDVEVRAALEAVGRREMIEQSELTDEQRNAVAYTAQRALWASIEAARKARIGGAPWSVEGALHAEYLERFADESHAARVRRFEARRLIDGGPKTCEHRLVIIEAWLVPVFDDDDPGPDARVAGVEAVDALALCRPSEPDDDARPQSTTADLRLVELATAYLRRYPARPGDGDAGAAEGAGWVHLRLAEAHLAAHRDDRAGSALDASLALAGGHRIDAARTRIRALAAAGRWHEIDAEITALLEDPELARGEIGHWLASRRWRACVEAAMWRADLEAADRCIAPLLLDEPPEPWPDPETRAALGRYLTLRGRPADARVIEREDPTNSTVDLRRDVALELLEVGRNSDAVSAARSAMERAPRLSTAMRATLARVVDCEAKRRPRHADEAYRRAGAACEARVIENLAVAGDVAALEARWQRIAGSMALIHDDGTAEVGARALGALAVAQARLAQRLGESDDEAARARGAALAETVPELLQRARQLAVDTDAEFPVAAALAAAAGREIRAPMPGWPLSSEPTDAAGEGAP